MKHPCRHNCPPGMYQGDPDCGTCLGMTHRLGEALKSAAPHAQPAASFRLPDLRTRDDAVQHLRERLAQRVAKGAEAMGKLVEELSNRQRRLLQAVAELPELFPVSRPDRPDGEVLSRDLCALRKRLDWLVRLEEEHGDGQRGCHENRAERNALIRTLAAQAERVGFEVRKPAEPPPGQRYQPEYITEVHDMARAAIEDGYTTTAIARPGVLFKEHTPEITVPMSVWFLVRGYMLGREA